MPPERELLFLSPVVPAATGNGLAMRAGMVLEALAEHYRISLLVVRLFDGTQRRVAAHYERLCRRTAIVDPRVVDLEPTPASTSGSPRRRAWRRRSRWEAILDELRDVPFDTIHVFRLAMAPYARRVIADRAHRPRLDLDLDDIESRTHRRLAELCRANGEPARARVEDVQAERSERAEEEAFRDFDRIYVCSEADQTLLRGRAGDSGADETLLPRRAGGLRGRAGAQICVLPNAVAPARDTAPVADRGPFRLLFVGTLGYYPNQDAVGYLCREIVPRLRELSPRSIEVDVVGGGASSRLRQAAEAAGVRLRGPVPRLARWYRRASMVVVPIRAGGGTRIKIIEAWSHRRPVVSTSIGAEGLDAREQHEILIADDPMELCQACLRLIQDRALADRLVEGGHDLFRARYSAEAMRRTVASFHGRVG